MRARLIRGSEQNLQAARERLRYWREQRGLTASKANWKLAQAMEARGLNDEPGMAYISHVEAGYVRVPDPTRLQVYLEDVLQVPAEERALILSLYGLDTGGEEDRIAPELRLALIRLPPEQQRALAQLLTHPAAGDVLVALARHVAAAREPAGVS